MKKFVRADNPLGSLLIVIKGKTKTQNFRERPILKFPENPARIPYLDRQTYSDLFIKDAREIFQYPVPF
jgi:hypothetical protein